MRTPIDPAGCVEVARVSRSGMVESRHLGAAAVVDPRGDLVRGVGDTAGLVYPRSTVKPIQAISVLRAGVALKGPALVLATASHAGSPEHVAVVRDMLAAAGLTEHDLQCPAEWPLGREFANDLIRSGEPPTRLHMNCSGKHAAFLLACVQNGWPTETYLDPAHPLQLAIRENVAEFTGEAVEHSGIDGCGAPVHAVSLAGLARATGRVTSSTDSESARLTAAIRADPWAIDGHGRANTVVIERLGLIAKLGAEGVMVMGAPDGHAVAVKILDGSLRAATLVALELLVQARVISREAAEPILRLSTERVLGGGTPVGEISAVVEGA